MRFLILPVFFVLAASGLAGCAKPPEERASLTDPDVEVASLEVDTSGSRAFWSHHHGSLAGRDLWVGSINDLDLRPGEVILTFDDGPSPSYTPRILSALDDYGVSAVFFMVGNMAKAHPETAQAVALAGHTVGTHTMGHNNLAQVSMASASSLVGEGERAVADALDPVHRSPAPFFRFPYLADSTLLRSNLSESGLVIFDVDVDSHDYLHDSPDQVLARVLRRLDAKGKGIVLFHDIHARTASMLPDFLEALKERGYTVVRARPRNTTLFNAPLVTASN